MNNSRILTWRIRPADAGLQLHYLPVSDDLSNKSAHTDDFSLFSAIAFINCSHIYALNRMSLLYLYSLYDNIDKKNGCETIVFL